MLPWVQSGGGDIGIGYWQRRAIQLKMSYEHILIDAEDGVGIVTLNRPHKLNAMHRQLSSELHDAVNGWRPTRQSAALSSAAPGRRTQ
jgi:1,4-dihydroxy-2-naphthoyl-CoA synthase